MLFVTSLISWFRVQVFERREHIPRLGDLADSNGVTVADYDGFLILMFL